MARAHTVAFMSPFCTVRLTYRTKREAKAECAAHYGTKFWSLLGATAQYEGRQKVRRKRKRGTPRFPLRPDLELEPVPVIALFDNEFMGHMARARDPVDMGEAQGMGVVAAHKVPARNHRPGSFLSHPSGGGEY